MIIGLTGLPGAGKGTVAKILEDKGFKYFSLSDVLRDILKKENIEITRKALIDKAKELREKEGAGVLAKIELTKNCVVDSIRHPEEVKILKEKGMILWSVTASLPICVSRLKERGREEDPKTLMELEQQLIRENYEGNQKLFETIGMADYTIDNMGTIDDLKRKVESVLNKIRN